ncbi:caffeoyl-CoA O-methyltransferase [Clostridium tetanomorphum]|uniref:tRNA 5-hydroxyuridine methyltransferase n=1 Tax=Clostridium tetanomorphum TaxID=1553 RepID=A0A923J2V6_CLOTT|nr:O-methyltransferase [Clostridium tetanomorphum]KAJ52825.1 O-methyltransferase [Clostridium tetanomorphum DSM 665]MBC2399188.1 O-methyltransferase [Clostridium tetanomorphum]MBP1865410.1 caffeoyl-CoA O-methyltransferase [Clostridium tetanomorphum]NRS84823.1 caffeoyl-CoA O-methyltransferase [Clostridium tetanomorphum]NRZ98040.1 caffeoyl-CoA O-methyltransferase [Clostridium tetanomorphum]
MSGITYDYMEEYIRGLIKENDPILMELEEYAHKNNVPIIHKEVGKFLELMINIKKPKKILELGTAIGYSAILMETASREKCEIVTVERDKQMISIAKENISKYKFEEKIKIVEGDCLEVLENLQEKFDLIFMDAGKGHYNHFLPHCLRLLEEDGIIISDNVLFRGMIASDELVKRRKITIVKRMRKFLEMVSDEEFITSVIPMGDGIAVTTRRNRDE